MGKSVWRGAAEAPPLIASTPSCIPQAPGRIAAPAADDCLLDLLAGMSASCCHSHSVVCVPACPPRLIRLRGAGAKPEWWRAAARGAHHGAGPAGQRVPHRRAQRIPGLRAAHRGRQGAHCSCRRQCSGVTAVGSSGHAMWHAVDAQCILRQVGSHPAVTELVLLEGCAELLCILVMALDCPVSVPSPG